MVWTAGQRARMRQTQEGHMPDVCQIWYASIGRDEDGQETEPVWDFGGNHPCGFQPLGSVEPGSGVVTTQDHVRLPYALAGFVSSHDRIHMTGRYGDVLDPPLVYEIEGQPADGPTGIVCALVRITT